MSETHKLYNYRKKNGYDLFFNGIGIDIGGGHDTLSKEVFNGITDITSYDTSLGLGYDANTCHDLDDESFDFVYSSHCLEHLDDPASAIRHWVRICKKGGFLVCCVPHEIFYEKCKWPSKANPRHKSSWTLEWKSNLPKSIHTPDFLKSLESESLVDTVYAKTILENFDFNHFDLDQTFYFPGDNTPASGVAICQIEFVLKKLDSTPTPSYPI